MTVLLTVCDFIIKERLSFDFYSAEMPLWKAWDMSRLKRKSLMADDFEEFLSKGKLLKKFIKPMVPWSMCKNQQEASRQTRQIYLLLLPINRSDKVLQSSVFLLL